jgi:hypothetical protein
MSSDKNCQDKSYVSVIKGCDTQAITPVPTVVASVEYLSGAKGDLGPKGGSVTVTPNAEGALLEDEFGGTAQIDNGGPGEDGPIGPEGLVPAGEFVLGESYTRPDLVTESGSSYTPKVGITATSTPFVGNAQWQLVAARGLQGNDGTAGIGDSYAAKVGKLGNQSINPLSSDVIRFNEINNRPLSFENSQAGDQIFDPVVSTTKFNVVETGIHIVHSQITVSNVPSVGSIIFQAFLNGDTTLIVGQITRETDNTSSLQDDIVEPITLNLTGAFFSEADSDYIEFKVINNTGNTLNVEPGNIKSWGMLGRWTSQGVQGIQGEAATADAGAATTVPFGDPATVTNSGTTEAAIFDFEIPQGEQGIQGIQGNNGVESANYFNYEFKRLSATATLFESGTYRFFNQAVTITDIEFGAEITDVNISINGGAYVDSSTVPIVVPLDGNIVIKAEMLTADTGMVVIAYTLT